MDALSPTPTAFPPRRWPAALGPEVVILIVALLLRLLWLELKPPHFDEGVNGYFVDRMTEQGFYHYDPTNFHGPFHFYVLFLAQTLLGRHVWALRLPLALVSTGCVALVLAYRRYFALGTCRLAALAMALSPAMTFYGRYAIHESWLLFFLLLLGWGALGLLRDSARSGLAATVLGATGCVLTKEVYLIHFLALGLALPALFVLERVTRTPPEPLPPARWNELDAWRLVTLAVGLIAFFYSGGLLDPSSLIGLVTTFHAWVATGTDPVGGHNKVWYYWFQLLARYEWPTLLGIGAAGWILLAERGRALRFLTLAGSAVLTGYSIVRYKTPWCVISILWPFLFTFAEGIRLVARRLYGGLAAVLALAMLGHSAWAAWRLNFYHFADDTEPYAYVQTQTEIACVLDPLRRLVAADPRQRFLTGYVLFPGGDGHPLQWLLADFPRLEFSSLPDPKDQPLGTDLLADLPSLESPPKNEAPPTMDADLLVAEDSYVSDLEKRLTDRYFRRPFTLRGSSGQTVVLYLRYATFAALFPGREPEFPLPSPPEPQ